MMYVVFIGILLLCSPLSYFAVKVLFFYYRYGFISVDSKILPIRVRRRSYQLEYLPEIYTVTQVLQNNLLGPYMLKMQERGMDTNLMFDVMVNTDISIQKDIRYGENKLAAAKAEWGYTGKEAKLHNVILLNASHMKTMKMTHKVTAGLIMHELAHHYLAQDEGTPWGKGFSETHSHPIWKILGV